MIDPMNPWACDEPGCKFIGKNPRQLHKHYCDVHLPGQIVRPSRIGELRRIMREGTDAT